MFLKLLLVNIFFEVILLTIIDNMATWVQWLNLGYHVLIYIIFCFLCKLFLQIPWEKFSVIFIVADIRTMLCSFIPVTIISYLFHYNIIENITKKPTIYNWITIPFSILFIFLTQQIGKKFFDRIKYKALKYPKFWKGVLFFYVLGAIHSSCSVELFYPFIFIVAFIAIIMIIYFAYRKKKMKLLELSNGFLHLQQNMILQYYESLKEQIELTKKMRHDINNHMQIMESIRQEYEGKALASYANDLREQYERLEPVYYCDNVVINALLSNKSKKCKKESISFEANMREFDMGNLTEYDLAGILFNLLDNAIEGCLKIPDKEKRYIRLNCFSDAGQLLIHVENSCMEQETSDKAKAGFFTSKPDKKRHGIGMGIIEDTARKYGGGMEVKRRECRFEVVVNIPVGTDSNMPES